MRRPGEKACPWGDPLARQPWGFGAGPLFAAVSPPSQPPFSCIRILDFVLSLALPQPNPSPTMPSGLRLGTSCPSLRMDWTSRAARLRQLPGAQNPVPCALCYPWAPREQHERWDDMVVSHLTKPPAFSRMPSSHRIAPSGWAVISSLTAPHPQAPASLQGSRLG